MNYADNKTIKTPSNYTIVENLSDTHINQLIELFQKMWWTIGRTKDDVDTLLTSCKVFGIVDTTNNKLVGFARVLTDGIKYAYIYDVMTVESARKIGLGKMMMNYILQHPAFQKVKYFELTCAQDMVGYYEQFGFSEDYGNVAPMRHTIT